MFVHLFASQTNHSRALLNMLEGEMDLADHLFIFGIGRDHPVKFHYSPLLQERILFLKNPWHVARILRQIYRAKWV